MDTKRPERVEQSSVEPPQPSLHTIEDASISANGSNIIRMEDDVIRQELARIVSIEPGRKFIEKEAYFPCCRFYRPGVLFALCFIVLIVVTSVFVFSRTTGIHNTFCASQSREQLLTITWTVIVVAIAIGAIACIIIFAMPTTRKMMNWLLRRTPTEQCELSEEDKNKILPELADNQYLHLRLAGSAGDGFGCFFGQNGNIGLTRAVDFCQDLDLNIVYDTKSDKEYSFQNLDPGFVTVNLKNTEGVLGDMIIDQESSGAIGVAAVGTRQKELLMSGSKVLEKMKSVLDTNMDADRSVTTPPAQRVEKDVTNHKGMKHPIQYDYVFSLASLGWPAEASEVSVLQFDKENTNMCYVVPKPWTDAKEDENAKIWRYSFTEAEAELFKLFNKHHKILIKCYIILKFIIKFEHVSRFPLPKCCHGTTEDKEVALKSYFLKTIFLHIAYELESRRVTEKQLVLTNEMPEDENLDALEEDYHIYCDPEELEATLSNRISPLSERMFADDNLMDSNGVFVISTWDKLRLTPAATSKSPFRQALSISVPSEKTDPNNKIKTLDYDAIFVLILTLYMTAMQRRTLMHFFVLELNLLRGFAEKLCDDGRKTLHSIKRTRLARVLDFQDFWASRTVLHISYLAVLVALLVLISLVGVTIYGSVWLMNRDINDMVCPINDAS